MTHGLGPHIVDIRDQRFGELKVLRFVFIRSGHAYWLCRCNCGSPTIARGAKLRSGEVLSCGHLRRDSNRKRALRLKLPAKRRRAIAQRAAEIRWHSTIKTTAPSRHTRAKLSK